MSVYKESSMHGLMLNREAGPEVTFDRSLLGAKELRENLNTSLCDSDRTIVVEKMHRSILCQMAKRLMLFIYDPHSGKVHLPQCSSDFSL